MDSGVVTINGKASGEHIRKIFDHQHDHPTRLLDKLTDLHFNYDCFDKMRVYLAVQILSESCASAIEQMISDNFFNSDEGPTATMIFCRNMNILFDLLNAKDKRDLNPNKRGVSMFTINILKDLKNYVASFMPCKGKKVFWIDGLQQSVNCVIGLYEESYQQRDVPLMTRLLNQDPLENLFGVIRGQTTNSQNPYLLDFLRILSRILTTKFNIHAKSTNCEWDPSCDIKLIDLANIKSDIDDKSTDEEDLWIDFDITKNTASSVSVNKAVIGFKNKYQCSTCEISTLKIIAENISAITHQIIKSNPCIPNITKEILFGLEEYCGEQLNNLCTIHHEQFLCHITNKCILNSLKTTRNILQKKSKSKKPAFYVHYKLRIIKDK